MLLAQARNDAAFSRRLGFRLLAMTTGLAALAGVGSWQQTAIASTPVAVAQDLTADAGPLDADVAPQAVVEVAGVETTATDVETSSIQIDGAGWVVFSSQTGPLPPGAALSTPAAPAAPPRP